MADGLFSEKIKGYRANPKNKFGSKDKLETIPTSFNKNLVYDLATVLEAGKKLGVKDVSNEQLVNMLLNEGRSDAGFNEWNIKNKAATKVYNELLSQGYNSFSSGFAAAVLDKQQTAARLNKSFDEVWNGVGKTPAGRTGLDNAIRMQQGEYAASANKNKELLLFVEQARKNILSPEEKLATTFTDLKREGRLFGGLPSVDIKDQVIANLQKTDPVAAAALSKVSPYQFDYHMSNQFLKNNKIETRQPNIRLVGVGTPNKQTSEWNTERLTTATEQELLFSKPSVREEMNKIATQPIDARLAPYQPPGFFENPLLATKSYFDRLFN